MNPNDLYSRIEDDNFKSRIYDLHLIVAVDENGGFGKAGKIPWHIAEDFKHFQAKTKDTICIMGRRTYTDMLEMVKARQKKPKKVKQILANRDCHVLTRNPDLEVEGVTAHSSLIKCVQSLKADDPRKIFILGGDKLYTESLPYVNTIEMTIVKGETYDCDRFFNLDYLKKKFQIIDGRETNLCRYVTYKRVRQ